MADLALAYMSAYELARRIRHKEISPVDVVKNALARIAEVNPKLNGFCFVFPEEALAQAKAAEAKVVRGDELGPLHGVPIAIKDLTPTKGKRTTLGSKIYEHNVPERDAVIVERLLGAGAIMVGKTTTPEFAYSGFTWSPLWGISRNPWNPERTPGGSSGGSAIAVATGCVPIAEGSDAGGSVRIPAAFSGVVGLKPSFGRIPLEVLPTQQDTIFHFGPLARTVTDAALFLNVVQGPDDRDINSLPAAPAVPLPVASDARGLRLALCPDQNIYALDPEVEANTRAAAEALREAGAHVAEVRLGWDRRLVDDHYMHWDCFMAAFFGQHLPKWRDRMTPGLVQAMEGALKVSAVELRRYEITRKEAWDSLRAVLEHYDAVLTATCAIAAPRADGWDSEYFAADERGRVKGFEMTCTVNGVSACPALSVPSGFTSEGLPTGLQIIGRRHDEAGVLRIGAALERVRPWAQRRPPL